MHLHPQEEFAPNARRSSSLPPKVWQWMRESAAITRMMPGAAEVNSDARGQPSTAFVAAERVGGTVDSDGADIAREREKKFRERPLLHLLLRPTTRGRLLKAREGLFRAKQALQGAFPVHPRILRWFVCELGPIWSM